MGRETVAEFGESERLLRRFLAGKDLAESISFNLKDSSTNLTCFCQGAEDALWNCEKGGRYENFGVLSIPADAFEGKTWQTDENVPAVFFIRVFHSPSQCNYAHADFQLFRNGVETQQIKPGSVKLKIRQYLTDAQLIRIEIAA
jgi:hypothetical protein